MNSSNLATSLVIFPDRPQVVRRLLANAVVGEDLVGGGEDLLTVEDDRLRAAVVEADRDVRVLRVAEGLDQMAEVTDAHAVDLLDDLGERVRVAHDEAMREHRRGDDDELLPLELGFVPTPRHERATD